MNWRDYFRPIIEKTVEQSACLPWKGLMKALAEAYPCMRMGWAYKVWLSERKRALNCYYIQARSNREKERKDQLKLI